MIDASQAFHRSSSRSSNIGKVVGRRVRRALKKHREDVERIATDRAAIAQLHRRNPPRFWTGGYCHALDLAQRSVLFLDTLRRRGNHFIGREQAGRPPVQHSDDGTLLDARSCEHPFNCTLSRLEPSTGAMVDDTRGPRITCPSASHGPGIAGFPNPLLRRLPAAAESVKPRRELAEGGHAGRRIERSPGDRVAATLDLRRDLRDATSEAQFVQVDGILVLLTLPDEAGEQARPHAWPQDARDPPVARKALASMAECGCAAALARAAEPTERVGASIPRSRIQLGAVWLGDLPTHEWRARRGVQDAIVEYDPAGALAARAALLADHADRRVVERLPVHPVCDPRVRSERPNGEHDAMLARIHAVFAAKPPRGGPRWSGCSPNLSASHRGAR